MIPIRGRAALLVDGEPFHQRLGDLGSNAPGGIPSSLVGGPPSGAVPDPGEIVLLGDRAGERWAARPVSAEEGDALARAAGGRMEDLRSAIGALPAWQGGLLAFAAALLAWHRECRFCGACGAPTRSRSAGHQRVCGSAGCGAVYFPRTDPAIITLVRHGDQALLVHQPSWPPNRLSTLAGFVEPGESLEQAVAREVDEEVGLAVDRVAYYASQPWPFPHTLMVGYRTEAAGRDLTLGDELDHARWFDRAGLRAALDSGDVTIPPPLSLSRSLIDDWLEGR